jgi:hypothetical protein
MRNAAPLMNTLAQVVAVSAIANIDQRRNVLIDETGMGASCHGCLKMLNLYLKI